MENYSVYEDIANRTGGDIYIGVVGPVRTGKSTFIKRFMQTLVLPFAADNERAVMTDELPQSASGRTVMTTEPKFVPAKAAKISVAKGAEASVRLVDCVGFAVEGANGFEEEGAPRLVKTPWQDAPMPFEQAAQIGTEKVICEHSTIGILMTTDGSVTDIPRESYVAAEEKAVNALKAIGKPFVVLLNCKNPSSQDGLAAALKEKYDVPVLAVNAETMDEDEMLRVLQTALFEFPVAGIDVKIPAWLQSFPEDNPFVSHLLGAVKKETRKMEKMRDCFALQTLFDETDDFCNPDEIKMELGKGKVEIQIKAKEGLFYRVLSDSCGQTIEDELQLMRYACALTEMKKGYDKVKDAFAQAEENGYGIVYPTAEEYRLEKPKLVKKSAGYGVQFQAKAASYHVVKVNVSGEVSPIIGTKEQGEDFVADTLQAYEDGDGVWETNIFGKSLRALVENELSGKSNAMPMELRKKVRRVMTRVVNEGKNTMLCFLF